MTHKPEGKGFSQEPERVHEAGKKGQGMLRGNLKRDPGRSVESGHRSNQNRIGGDDN